jgi:class 3 adenylate cyclase
MVCLTGLAIYSYNIIKWSEYPDFGFSFRTATGIHVVGVVREHGQKSGIRAGDVIREVNGRSYSSIEELRELIRWGTGEQNTYLIERKGLPLGIVIENVPSGFKRSFLISGIPMLVGLCYVLIGVIVFLMKPHTRSSWIFLIATALFGIFITFINPLGIISPDWLGYYNLFAYCFAPASFIHLSFSFPVARKFLSENPGIQAIPYFISLVLFLFISRETIVITYAPKPLLIATVAYMAVGVLYFIASSLQLRLTSDSQIAKSRASLILLGFAMTASLPFVDLISNAFFHTFILPGWNYYLPFFLFFPAFVGYAIVKHDLFDIDAIIKRTYGYVLTTGALAGIYGMFVLISNLVFGGYEFAQSRVFPIIFILAIVFLFNPVRNRVQRFIDRVFYRLEYDYQATVHKISETMRSLLDINEIGHSMMSTALGTLFVDKGYVLLLSKDLLSYECLVEAGEEDLNANDPATSESNPASDASTEEDNLVCGPEIAGLEIPSVDPLINKIAEGAKEITIYDIEEDPRFKDNRESYRRTFESMKATLLVPLIHEKRLTGLLALGRKKSGKFYRREDINLLNILANQGAVAIANARNVEEIVEKERARVQIMDAFGKYVTHEVRDKILEGRIPLDGESKDVTLLFADLRDFTTLAESTTPKEVVKIINGYFSEMAEAIGMNHGLVLQFIGDEIEAVFGAPMDLDDHPTHALRAAIEMSKRLVIVNRKLQQQGYGPLRHGIGVHTGPVVAANIGSEDRLSYAMVGDTVNLASRIQGLNKKYGTEVLVSSTAVSRLSATFPLEKLPATTVKGKKAPVEVFKLLE